MKYIVVDDELLCIKLIEKYLGDIHTIESKGSFTNSIEALDFYNAHQKDIDLIISDINMPNFNGISLLKSLYGDPMVIFTTAHGEFAINSFEFNIIDYILKPFEQPRLLKAIFKAQQLLKNRNEGAINKKLIFREQGRLIQLDYDSIICITGYSDYVKIQLTTSETIIVRLNLKDIEKRNIKNLTRIHKSAIISTGHIKSISSKSVILSNNFEVPIGRSYLSEFRKIS